MKDKRWEAMGCRLESQKLAGMDLGAVNVDFRSLPVVGLRERLYLGILNRRELIMETS